MEDTNPNLNTKPRNGFIALLLSIVFPGLGQVYNGQVKKGILFFTLLLFLPILFGLFQMTSFFYGLVFLVCIQLILRIVILIDAFVQGRKQKNYQLKKYNVWYSYLLIAVGMFGVLILYDLPTRLGIQTFKLPSPAQQPTIQVGDWVVADKQAYKREELDYGHIVIFERPDKQIWTFRVVGLPNDNLEIVDNTVSVNGKLCKSRIVKETIIDGNPVIEFEEELPNGHTHRIYKFVTPYNPAMTNIKNIHVPPDSYYLLGDNRDNAMDSRYIGAVKKEKILGRIIYSYWGNSIDRMNINFKEK